VQDNARNDSIQHFFGKAGNVLPEAKKTKGEDGALIPPGEE
jgi:hypothetical protein